MKAILWDLGNVLVRFDNRNDVCRRIAETFGGNLPDLFEGEGESAFVNLDIGEMNQVDLWHLVCRVGGINPNTLNLPLFSALFVTHLKAYEENVAVFKHYQDKCSMFAVSNGDFGSEFAYHMLQTDHGLQFKRGFISNQLGVKKPTLLELVASSIHREDGLRPKDCLYIDDIKEYLEEGENIGFHTLHFDARKQTAEKLWEGIEAFV